MQPSSSPISCPWITCIPKVGFLHMRSARKGNETHSSGKWQTQLPFSDGKIPLCFYNDSTMLDSEELRADGYKVSWVTQLYDGSDFKEPWKATSAALLRILSSLWEGQTDCRLPDYLISMLHSPRNRHKGIVRKSGTICNKGLKLSCYPIQYPGHMLVKFKLKLI